MKITGTTTGRHARKFTLERTSEGAQSLTWEKTKHLESVIVGLKDDADLKAIAIEIKRLGNLSCATFDKVVKSRTIKTK